MHGQKMVAVQREVIKRALLAKLDQMNIFYEKNYADLIRKENNNKDKTNSKNSIHHSNIYNSIQFLIYNSL